MNWWNLIHIGYLFILTLNQTYIELVEFDSYWLSIYPDLEPDLYWIGGIWFILVIYLSWPWTRLILNWWNLIHIGYLFILTLSQTYNELMEFDSYWLSIYPDLEPDLYWIDGIWSILVIYLSWPWARLILNWWNLIHMGYVFILTLSQAYIEYTQKSEEFLQINKFVQLHRISHILYLMHLLKSLKKTPLFSIISFISPKKCFRG